MRRITGIAFLASALPLLSLVLFSSPAGAVTAGQVDDFEDGLKGNWRKGQTPTTTATLTNVTTGGPEGVDDNFLRSTSNGNIATVGSRQTMMNTGQWRGNYVAAQITSLQAKVRNFGGTDLFLRVAVEGATGFTKYASTDPVIVLNDGQWHTVTLPLFGSSLTLVEGTSTLVEVLSDVDTFRLISVEAGPGWRGDTIATDMGIDDITAVGLTPTRATTWGRIKQLY